MNKTWKREYAFAFFGMIVWSWYKGDTGMLEMILYPFVAYIAAVSGVHMYFNSERKKQ